MRMVKFTHKCSVGVTHFTYVNLEGFVICLYLCKCIYVKNIFYNHVFRQDAHELENEIVTANHRQRRKKKC